MYAWDLKGKNRSELGLTTVAGDQDQAGAAERLVCVTRNQSCAGRKAHQPRGRAGGGVWPTE